LTTDEKAPESPAFGKSMYRIKRRMTQHSPSELLSDSANVHEKVFNTKEMIERLNSIVEQKLLPYLKPAKNSARKDETNMR